MWFLERLFGDDNQKMIARYQKDVAKIRSLEASLIEEYTSLEQVQSRTKEFISRFSWLDIHIDSDRATIKSILEEIKHEAIALHSIGCRLLSGTTHTLSDDKVVLWNMVPYDVQIIGALALNDRRIAEMRTGEGKTLVATIAAYLNALTGYPVHVVTVNDYLARRDSEEMGILYKALGLSVGVIVHNQSSEVKKEMYRSNIVYATNNELGFDYLRDNMVSKLEDRVMSPLSYALIDEVDSILIDEARTPLIISAPDSEPTNKYMKFAAIARSLEKHTHYKVDEKARSTILSEEGIKRVEEILGVENIYTSSSYNDLHHIENALKAESLFERDKDYIVRNNEILIVDEHTGRVLSGRRYSDGLHQAIEAREGVEIKQETKTLASITFQRKNFIKSTLSKCSLFQPISPSYVMIVVISYLRMKWGNLNFLWISLQNFTVLDNQFLLVPYRLQKVSISQIFSPRNEFLMKSSMQNKMNEKQKLLQKLDLLVGLR